jgi:apolipoprotein N-acyltransferase
MRYSTVHCDGVIRGLQRPPSSHHAPRDELLAEMLKTPKRKSQRLELGRANDTAEQSSAPTRQSQLIADYQTLFLGLTGSLLLWGAFPPLNLPWLAWLAPVPWLYLAQRPTLAGWRPYFVLWFCGTVHWLLMLQGIRLAHPALYAGWIALSAYLGVYLPVFIGLTRVAVHRFNISIIAAAPAIWIGLELLRGRLFTGFSIGLLAHTQAELPYLIQISDLAGGYVLSGLIVLVAACLTGMGGCGLRSKTRSPFVFLGRMVVVACLAMAVTIGYGHWRLNQSTPGQSGPTAKVALIQGSLDTVFDVTADRIRETFDQYNRLTNEAVGNNPNLDLVAWPESMFAIAETVANEPIKPPAGSGLSTEEFARRLNAIQIEFKAILAEEAARANANTSQDSPGTKLLVGTTTFDYESDRTRVYNAALLADKTGKVIGRYYKTHPVMFGEYIPFADILPWLYKITPMSGGLSIGEGPKIFEVGNLKMSPSVCFESTVPHLIRGQLNQLSRAGTPADCLINITNDGWFWGTAILDLHLRCAVFRAVENRKPMLVVANTGISAFADGNGVVRLRGPRRQSQALLAAVQADGRFSPYSLVGDWPAWICAACCLALAWAGIRGLRVSQVEIRQILA